MYVCICYAISKSKLCTLISEGAQTLPALQSKCRAGTNCGSCVNKLKNLLTKEKLNEEGKIEESTKATSEGAPLPN
jgi:bacterioferritin-associated ferredoxin